MATETVMWLRGPLRLRKHSMTHLRRAVEALYGEKGKTLYLNQVGDFMWEIELRDDEPTPEVTT